jgi:enoyl-CoA hydratase
VAGGTEILQATEIRVAGESAQFGVAEVRRGLFPLGGSTVRLQRQIAYTDAADLLLTGRLITAPEAKEMGLIGHVVPDGQALLKARELADQIAANGPVAVKAVLRSMREAANLSEEDGLANELELGWPVLGSADAKEGPKAFAEKRAPNFVGH